MRAVLRRLGLDNGHLTAEQNNAFQSFCSERGLMRTNCLLLPLKI